MINPEEKNIKNKIDNLSDIDLFINDSQLWERLETRLVQKKTRKNRFALYWLSAGAVVISLSFYLFLSPANTSPLTHSVTKNTATSIPQPNPETIIQYKPVTPKITQRPTTNVVEHVTLKDSLQDNTMPQKILATDVVILHSIDIPVLSEHSKDLLQYPIVFKAQRVTTLSLPTIPDEMMERESFARRALRQIRNFNTEGKIDLRELNIEPRNVWAYLERSFFHDTTKTTKLNPYKP
jgi:hypothetical protein